MEWIIVDQNGIYCIQYQQVQVGDLIFGSRGNLGKFLGKAHRNGKRKKSPNLELPLRELKRSS